MVPRGETRAMAMRAGLDPHALLSLFSTHVPNAKEEANPRGLYAEHRTPTRVYVVGVNERRVTLYSQQSRALNLVWLLHETGVLTRGGDEDVAVIGAGGS